MARDLAGVLALIAQSSGTQPSTGPEPGIVEAGSTAGRHTTDKSRRELKQSESAKGEKAPAAKPRLPVALALVLNNYQSKLPFAQFADLMLDFSGKLLQLKMPDTAIRHCHDRLLFTFTSKHGSCDLARLRAVRAALAPDELRVWLETLIARAAAKYAAMTNGAAGPTQGMAATAGAGLEACTAIRDAATCAQASGLAWLVYNATVQIFAIARQLLAGGRAGDVLPFVLESILLVESLVELQTVTHLAWRTTLYVCAAQCYLDLGLGSHAQTTALRGLERLQMLQSLDAASTTPAPARVFDVARTALNTIVFVVSVWTVPRGASSPMAMRRSRMGRKDMVTEVLRTSCDELLERLVAPLALRLQAVNDALWDPRRRTLLHAPLASQPDATDPPRSTEAWADIFACGRQICLAIVGPSATPYAQVVRFLQHCFACEQWDTFADVVRVLNAPDMFPDFVPAHKADVDLLVSLAQARVAIKGRPLRFGSYAEPDTGSRAFPADLAPVARALLACSGGNPDIVLDAALHLWARARPFYIRLTSDVLGRRVGPTLIPPGESESTSPRVQLVAAVHGALQAVRLTDWDPVLAAEVALAQSAVMLVLGETAAAAATLTAAIASVSQSRTRASSAAGHTVHALSLNAAFAGHFHATTSVPPASASPSSHVDSLLAAFHLDLYRALFLTELGLIQPGAQRDDQPNLPGKRSALGSRPRGVSADTEARLRAMCGQNPYIKALLLSCLATAQPVDAARRKLLSDAAAELVRARAYEQRLIAARAESADDTVSLVSSSPSSLVVSVVPPHGTVSVRLFARPLADAEPEGPETKVRVVHALLDGSDEDQLLLDANTGCCQFTLGNLEPNTRYVIAAESRTSVGSNTAAATKDSTGKLGPVSTALLTAQPLSLLALWGYLAECAITSRSLSAATAASARVIDYYCGTDADNDALMGSTVVPPLAPSAVPPAAPGAVPSSDARSMKALKVERMEAATSVDLRILARASLVYVDSVMQHKGLVANRPDTRVDLTGQWERVRLAQHLVSVLVAAARTGDASLVLQVAAKGYSVLAPLLFCTAAPAPPLLPLLTSMTLALVELSALPRSTLPSHAMSPEGQHMLACLAAASARALSAAGMRLHAVALLSNCRAALAQLEETPDRLLKRRIKRKAPRLPPSADLFNRLQEALELLATNLDGVLGSGTPQPAGTTPIAAQGVGSSVALNLQVPSGANSSNNSASPAVPDTRGTEDFVMLRRLVATEPLSKLRALLLRLRKHDRFVELVFRSTQRVAAEMPPEEATRWAGELLVIVGKLKRLRLDEPTAAASTTNSNASAPERDSFTVSDARDVPDFIVSEVPQTPGAAPVARAQAKLSTGSVASVAHTAIAEESGRISCTSSATRTKSTDSTRPPATAPQQPAGSSSGNPAGSSSGNPLAPPPSQLSSPLSRGTSTTPTKRKPVKQRRRLVSDLFATRPELFSPNLGRREAQIDALVKLQELLPPLIEAHKERTQARGSAALAQLVRTPWRSQLEALAARLKMAVQVDICRTAPPAPAPPAAQQVSHAHPAARLSIQRVPSAVPSSTHALPPAESSHAPPLARVPSVAPSAGNHATHPAQPPPLPPSGPLPLLLSAYSEWFSLAHCDGQVFVWPAAVSDGAAPAGSRIGSFASSPSITDVCDVFALLRRAAVLALRAETWVDLQNVAKCAHSFVLVAARTLDCTANMAQTMGGDFVKHMWVIADCLADMVEVGRKQGWLRLPRAALSPLGPDAACDDNSLVHLAGVSRFVCLVLALLRESGRTARLVDLSARFNHLTEDQFAQLTLPLTLAAVRAAQPSKHLPTNTLASIEAMCTSKLGQLAAERGPAGSALHSARLLLARYLAGKQASAVDTASKQAALAPTPPARAVVQAYRDAIAALRTASPAPGLLAVALFETGCVLQDQGDHAAATDVWQAALANLLASSGVFPSWVELAAARGEHVDKMLKVLGIWACLLAGLLAHHAARLGLGGYAAACLAARQFAAECFSRLQMQSLEQFSSGRPGLQPLYVPASGLDLASVMRRCNPVLLLDAIESTTHALVGQGAASAALPVLSLGEHLATVVCDAVPAFVRLRCLRIGAASELGLFALAIRLARGLVRGTDLPDLFSFGARQATSAVGLVADNQPELAPHLGMDDPVNVVVLDRAALEPIASHVSAALGPALVSRVIVARAAMLTAIAAVVPATPREGFLFPSGRPARSSSLATRQSRRGNAPAGSTPGSTPAPSGNSAGPSSSTGTSAPAAQVPPPSRAGDRLTAASQAATRPAAAHVKHALLGAVTAMLQSVLRVTGDEPVALDLFVLAGPVMAALAAARHQNTLAAQWLLGLLLLVGRHAAEQSFGVSRSLLTVDWWLTIRLRLVEQLYLAGCTDLSLAEAQHLVRDATKLTRTGVAVRAGAIEVLVQALRGQLTLGPELARMVASMHDADSTVEASILLQYGEAICVGGAGVTDSSPPDAASPHTSALLGLEALGRCRALLEAELELLTGFATVTAYLGTANPCGTLAVLPLLARCLCFLGQLHQVEKSHEAATAALAAAAALCRIVPGTPVWLEATVGLALADSCAALSDGGDAICRPLWAYLWRDVSNGMQALLARLPLHAHLECELLCQALLAATHDGDHAIARQALLRLVRRASTAAAHSVASTLLAGALRATAALAASRSPSATLRLSALPAVTRTQLPEWALAVFAGTRLGAVAPPVRDISKALPTLPATDTARAGVSGADLLARRGALMTAANLLRSSPLTDVFACRAAELHRLLAEAFPEYNAVRGLPDLSSLLAVRVPAHEVTVQWLVPTGSGQTFMLCSCRAGEMVTGVVGVAVPDALALRRRLQDLLALSSPPEAEVRACALQVTRVLGWPADHATALTPALLALLEPMLALGSGATLVNAELAAWLARGLAETGAKPL